VTYSGVLVQPPLVLGPLEEAVLEAVWGLGGERSVRDVLAAMTGAPAYTTIMTTLERLSRKGLLRRRKEGRAFVYAAAVTRSELTRRRASRILGGLLSEGASAPEPILSCLVDAVGAHDRVLLDRLEELIRRKKQERP
jgi:predicted transcriptional regulator